MDNKILGRDNDGLVVYPPINCDSDTPINLEESEVPVLPLKSQYFCDPKY